PSVHLREIPASAVPELRQIFDSAERSRHSFMAERTRLEAMRQGIARRPDLVGEGLFQQLLASPQDSLMRTEELVGGRDEDVAAEFLQVDASMRRELYRIDIDESPGLP